METLSISRKDMLILIKDRSTFLQVFLLPLVFIILYVGIGTAVQGEPEADQRIPIPVVNLDGGSEMSNSLIENLNSDGGVRVVDYTEASGQSGLESGELDRLLIIPAGFHDEVMSGENSAVILDDRGEDAQESEAVNVIVVGVANDLSVQANILGGLEQMRQMQADDPEAEQALSAEKSIEQARWQFERALEEPLIGVVQSTPAIFEEREEESLNFVELAVPSMTVLFVFLTAQVTAASIYEEKKVGSFRRLLAAPITRASLMIGKMLPNFTTVILQVIVIFFAGIVIFPLLGWDQLTLGNNLLALGLLIVMTAICCTALGVLISALAKTEAQIGGLSTVILWVMAFIGGTIVPFFLINETLETLGKFTPQYWAVTGFYDLLVRRLSLGDVTDSLIALAVFSLIFFGVAIWRFDYE